MAELEEYLRKSKNCTLTEGMIQKILEMTKGYAEDQRLYAYSRGHEDGCDYCSS